MSRHAKIVNIVRRSIGLPKHQPTVESPQLPSLPLAPVEPERGGERFFEEPIPELPQRPDPIAAYKHTWLCETRASSNVKAFVFNGGRIPPPSEIERFLAPTVTYIIRRGHRVSQRSDLDTVLLDWAGAQDARDDVLVVLASSIYLSAPAASRELRSLIIFDPAIYLRCLMVAIAARGDIVEHFDKAAVQAAYDLSTEVDRDTALTAIESFLRSFIHCRPSAFLPDRFVLAWLRSCGAIAALRMAAGCWDGQRPYSTYRSVWCVQTLASVFGEAEVLGDQDNRSRLHWRALLCWAPNSSRLSQWEFGCLSSEQHGKLSRLLLLDGPDTATGRQSSLGMSEPACYGYFRIETRTTARLEQLLVYLSRAEMIGPSAVELFIRVFVDGPVDDAAIECFDQALCHLPNDAMFQQCLYALALHNDDADFCSQLTCLADSLQLLSVMRIPRLTGNLAARVEEVMRAAQTEFVAQLDLGPADYLGMCILELGNAIVQTPQLHDRLSPAFLQMVRRFPERDIAEAVFQRLEDAVVETSGRFSALKSHLISRLGGRTDYAGGCVDPADIQKEADFWKRCQDPDRRELARVLSGLKCLDYKAYTACLAAVIHEKSMFVKELRVELIEGNGTRACASLTTYLAGRRRQGQLSADCWTLLLVAFIKERGTLVQGGSHLRSMEEWLGFVQVLLQVAGPSVVQAEIASHGDGITQDRLAWWQTLSQHKAALKQIKTLVKGLEDVSWMYLTSEETAVRTLLEHAQAVPAISTRLVISLLRPDGANLVQVVAILNMLGTLSRHGKKIVETALRRGANAAGPYASWTEAAMAASIKTWLESSLITLADKEALRLIAAQLGIRPSGSRSSTEELLRLLHFDYCDIMERAQKLEAKRWKLKTTDISQHVALVQSVGIEDAGGKALGADIPPELADAVEALAPNQYELSFPLTGLNDLQRQARGVPKGARLLLVRVRLDGNIKFCIHCSPNDEPPDGQHKYWRKSHEPDQAVCTGESSLFGYYLTRNLHRLLKTSPKLADVHSNVERWVTKAPATCSVCGAAMGVELWKAATCSRACSLHLRRAPLQVRLHNLLVDPLSLDLLLASVYAASLDASNLDLLPGCPVAKTDIAAVINSLPPMATLAQAANLGQTLSTHRLGGEQEKLLSWLCLSFRGFMRVAPPGYVIPSMPGSQQFLVLNAHREREMAFEKHLGASGAGSGPVFHGTNIKRLFLIMSTGIRNVSNQPLMANGAAAGPGVYCGDEQQTSWGFACGLGQTWANSALNPQMRLMLGCELAKYPTVNTPTHVVQDETRILVRYVLLLPPNYRAPPRRHVAPAMSTAFAMLRSGRSS